MVLGVSLSWAHRAATPHLRGSLPPLEQGDAQLDDVLGALLPGHAQLAEDVLDAAALPGQGGLRRGSGSPAGKDALDGPQGLFVFNLAGDVLDDLADFDQVDGLLDEEVHPGGIGRATISLADTWEIMMNLARLPPAFSSRTTWMPSFPA